ncbi:MAG: Lar family restriction alleviation protein [Oscillospiraceae bacterium]|nr:Lar family restriction alleviation protein [Oscillospiraceae bacterium]
MKINPWDEVLLAYSQTRTLPPCPFCSQNTLTVEQNIQCAHTALYIYCANCGKWAHADQPRPTNNEQRTQNDVVF